MAHTLPALPYAAAALEPHIDARTMEIHHGKHHQAYITNLNTAIAGKPDLEAKSADALIADLSAVPADIRMAVRNNGGGHVNHTLFWEILAAGAGGTPQGAVGDAISAQLGGFDAFKEQFEKAGLTRFGSGWAWLCVGADKKLCVCSTPNQDNPTMSGIVDCPGTPILGCDVWEHAYYLHYQNGRADYLKAFWNVVNWAEVDRRHARAIA